MTFDAQWLEVAERLKHDLGKYISLQGRFLSEVATLGEKRAALRVDLRETRRGPDRVWSAAEVWAPYRELLVGSAPLPSGARVDLRGDPDVDDLLRDMEYLANFAEAIDHADVAAIEDALRRAAAVSAISQRLVRRARGSG